MVLENFYLLYLSIPSEARKEFGNFVKVSVLECLTSRVRLSVTSFSSHTSKARGLKIGMHNPYMYGSKVTDQIFA